MNWIYVENLKLYIIVIFVKFKLNKIKFYINVYNWWFLVLNEIVYDYYCNDLDLGKVKFEKCLV